MRDLLDFSIYVNASTAKLLRASRGATPSAKITERKRWTTGYKLFLDAKRHNKRLPLIFAQYADLTYWAVAADISVGESKTTFRFEVLTAIRDKRRSNLEVAKTGNPLPDQFIKSYAIVRTPPFLATYPSSEQASVRPPDLVEGAATSVMVTKYERDPRARELCIEHYGSSCYGCGFSFGKKYGKDFAGYIQVHHLTKVASRGGEYIVDPIRDLRPICPNCHAVIHSRATPLSVSELRRLIRGAETT